IGIWVRVVCGLECVQQPTELPLQKSHALEIDDQALAGGNVERVPHDAPAFARANPIAAPSPPSRGRSDSAAPEGPPAGHGGCAAASSAGSAAPALELACGPDGANSGPKPPPRRCSRTDASTAGDHARSALAPQNSHSM